MPGSRSSSVWWAAAALAAGAALASGAPRAAAQAPGAVEVSLSPALPAEGDALQARVDVVSPLPLLAGPVEVDAESGRILLAIEQAPTGPPRPPSPMTLRFDIVNLAPPGNYTVVPSFNGSPDAGDTLAFTLRPRTALLDLIGARFQVAVDRQLPGATAAAVRLSDSAGYFWFYDAGNPELTVKIVDGRLVNGHFWIFIASMTDTPHAVTVTDTSGGCQPAGSGPSPCPLRTYANPPHTNQNFIDTEAF